MPFWSRALIAFLVVLPAVAPAMPIAFAGGDESSHKAERDIANSTSRDDARDAGATNGAAAGRMAVPLTAMSVTAVLGVMAYGIVRRWFSEPGLGADSDSGVA